MSFISLVSVNDKPAALTFMLTASGGPIPYFSIAISGGVANPQVTPSSGSIPAGGSVMITVTVRSQRSFTARLVLSPGGQVIGLHVRAKIVKA
jgi:hypothetical protein